METRESWNSSDEKATELKIADFGAPEEVCEMAKPLRMAKNRYEAREILKDIVETRQLLTSKSGLIVKLPRKSIGKLVSGTAVNTSFSEGSHYLAVANIDKLFSNAIEPWNFELNPQKQNQDLRVRRYLYAPLEYGNKIIPVKFTIKEYAVEGLEKKLYSIEAIDAEIGR